MLSRGSPLIKGTARGDFYRTGIRDGLALVPEYVGARLRRPLEEVDERIGALPQRYLGLLLVAAAFLGGRRGYRRLEPLQGWRDVLREQRTRHGAAVSHRLQQRHGDVAEHGDAAHLAVEFNEHD